MTQYYISQLFKHKKKHNAACMGIYKYHLQKNNC